jgi:hypothetical protein
MGTVSAIKGLDREVRTFVRDLLRGGRWEVAPSGRTGHLKLRHCATGRTLPVQGSPSDWRSLRNLRAQVRRIEQRIMDDHA